MEKGDLNATNTIMVFLLLIEEGLLSVTSESMCTKYCKPLSQACRGKKCGQMN